MANGLLEYGVTKQDMITFLAYNELDFFVLQMAATFLGITISTIYPEDGIFECSQQIENVEATVLVVDRKGLNLFRSILDDPQYQAKTRLLKMLIELHSKEPSFSHPKSPKTICTFAQLAKNGEGKTLSSIPYFPTKTTDPCVMIFSSGTTGLRKAAVYSHKTFMAGMSDPGSNSQEHYTVLQTYSAAHISTLNGMLSFYQKGYTIVLKHTYEIADYFELIDQYKLNGIIFSPEQIPEMIEEGFREKYDLSSLKLMVYGGCKTAKHMSEKLKAVYNFCPVYEVYGATEFIHSVQNSAKDTSKIGSVGRVAANCELKVIDLDSGSSLPPNQRGELCFRGGACFAGYFKDEKKTKEAVDERGWYHTGDLGYYDNDGDIFILDRIKETFDCDGYFFLPSEIEEFLLTLDSVRAVCVVGVEHVTEGLLPRAYIQLAPGHTTTTTERDILKIVQTSLQSCKWLRAGVKFVDRIPLTHIKKVDRKHFKNLVKHEVIQTKIQV